MTLPLDEDSRPPYLQAAAALRDAILTGEFTSGERLPSANVLGERFGVSSSTVQNALRVLKQEGLVYSQLGRGSFVSSTDSGSDAPDSPADEDGEESGPDWPADLIRNDDSRPPYVQVADFLRRDIAEGTYPPGSQLPPAREIQERFQVANSTAQNAYRSLKQEGLVYSVKGRGVFVLQTPEPGKHHGPITNYLLREEIAREARAAAADFADLTDDELLAREAELDQRWATIREEHQRIFNERRKIKRETSRRGLFLPPSMTPTPTRTHRRARNSKPHWPNRRSAGNGGPDQRPGSPAGGLDGVSCSEFLYLIKGVPLARAAARRRSVTAARSCLPPRWRRPPTTRRAEPGSVGRTTNRKTRSDRSAAVAGHLRGCPAGSRRPGRPCLLPGWGP